MTIFITIISFVAVILVITIAHELGHLIAAKVAKLKVDEFAIGFPPRLVSVTRGETRYSLNATPIGGFTKIAGEVDHTVPSGLASKGIGTRLIVLSAGSIMNALIPIILFSAAFVIPHDVVVGRVMVTEVAPDSPAWGAGIQPGDTLLRINEEPIQNIGAVQRYLQLNLGKETTVLIRRADATIERVQLTPQWKSPQGAGTTGMTVTLENTTTVSRSYPFWNAVLMAATEYFEILILFKNETVLWFFRSAVPTVTGPVGIAHMIGQAAWEGISPLLEFTAFFSINVAIVNLLPLPALDGGRIFFVLLEWVRRGRRVPAKIETMVHAIGFLMLLALILVITYYDIVRIIT